MSNATKKEVLAALKTAVKLIEFQQEPSFDAEVAFTRPEVEAISPLDLQADINTLRLNVEIDFYDVDDGILKSAARAGKKDSL